MLSILQVICRIKSSLDFEKIKMLELLPKWSWNPFEDQWNKGFDYLKQYSEEFGNARTPNGFKYNNFNLGAWVGIQRQEKDKLDFKKFQLLESLPQWSWSIKEEQWHEVFGYLKKYVEEYGHARVPHHLKYKNHSLGSVDIST